ncbi:MAG: hypothetical protein JNL59_14675, partial [Chitinophagaceae bacterium]|nr:hypothetical protein [Chitinophagaceae bacterium]
MKRFSVLVIGLTHAFTMAAQQQQDNEAIKSLLSTFMTAIKTRDSITMFSLFADVPVTWVGAWQPATLKARDANVKAPGYRVSDYKTWFRTVTADGY